MIHVRLPVDVISNSWLTISLKFDFFFQILHTDHTDKDFSPEQSSNQNMQKTVLCFHSIFTRKQPDN